MKKAYLASPYSHPDPKVREERFIEVCGLAASLMWGDNDLTVFSPIAHSHPIAVHGGLSGSADYWEKHNRAWLDWADVLFVADMEGTKESEGIRREIEYAINAKKRVVWL